MDIVETLIVITSKPNKESRAVEEVLDQLILNGIPADIRDIRPWGGVSFVTGYADFETIIRALMKPSFKRAYAKRVVPIYEVVPNNINEIISASLRVFNTRFVSDTFAVKCIKRGTIKPSLVENVVGRAIVKKYGCSVNLVTPQKILLIEGLGGQVGISVLRLNEYLRLMGRKKV